jgi:hypothetical protein
MAEEIMTSPEESAPMEAPINEAPVEVQENVVDVQPSPPSKGLQNLQKLHSLLVENDVYSKITPERFVDFVDKYKDPTKMQKLHSLLVENEVYSKIMPADLNAAADKYGFGSLGKPLAVPSALEDGGSATKERGVEQTSMPQNQYLTPEQLGAEKALKSESDLGQLKETFAQEKRTGKRTVAPLVTEDQLNAQRLASVERAKKEKETKALSEKGTYLGALRNTVADSFAKTVEDFAYTSMSALEAIAPDMIYGPGSENIPSAEKAKLFNSAMEDMGIKKSLEKEFYVTKDLSFPTKDIKTTPEYIERLNEEGGPIQQGITGLAGTLFPMAMQGPMKGAGFFVSTFADAKKEIQEAMPDANPRAQAFYALTQGVVAATLEEAGLSNLAKNKSVTKVLSGKVMDSIKNLTGFYSAKEIPSVVTNIINGYAAEFETGATQYLVSEGLKQVADAMEGDEDKFKFDGVDKLIANTFNAGNQEGIGGMIMKTIHSIPSLIKSPLRKKEVEQKIDESAQMAADITNPEVSPEAKAGIQNLIDENDDDVLSSYADDKAKFDSLPENQKQELETINQQLQSHQSLISDPNVSPETKAISEQRIQELEARGESILDAAKPVTQEVAPVAEQAPQEKGEFSVAGTFRGLTHILGSPNNMITDSQDYKFRNVSSPIFDETARNGKKIFTLAIPQSDDVNRAGYLAVSLVLPESTTKTIDDVKSALEAKMAESKAVVAAAREKGYNAADAFASKVSAEYSEEAAAPQAPVAEAANGEAPKIILSGLSDGFQGVSYESFDVRSDRGVMNEIRNGRSFAKIIEREGKRYIVVGVTLSPESKREATTSGRDNYSFAVAELNQSTPSDIVNTLENSAKENFKNIYRNFSDKDSVTPVNESAKSEVTSQLTPTTPASRQAPVAEAPKVELPKVKDEVNNAPITDRDNNNQDVVRYIPFSIVDAANKNDKRGGQTAKQIVDRGGYSVKEMDSLLPNWRDMLSQAQAPVAEVAKAEAPVVEQAPKAKPSVFADIDAAMEARGTAATEARAAAKETHGKENTDKAIRITREFDKIVKKLENEGMLTKKCP